MKIYRCEHKEIKDSRGRFFVGPWSERGWVNFPDQGMAYQTMICLGDEVGSWEEVHWEGNPTAKNDFVLRSGFNSKYLAGVESLEDFSFLKGWWDFLEMSGFTIREYSVKDEYVLIARRFDYRYLQAFDMKDEECLGRPNQVAFHWFHAKLIS